MKNQRILALVVVGIGVLLLVFNFIISKNATSGIDARIADLAKQQKLKKDNAGILPDIKRGESITSSEIRNKEVTKVTPSLPYYDKPNNIAILFDPKSSVIIARVASANSLADYRVKKQMTENKLVQLGVDNICNLLVVWSPPENVKKDLKAIDLHTSGCPS